MKDCSGWLGGWLLSRPDGQLAAATARVAIARPHDHGPFSETAALGAQDRHIASLSACDGRGRRALRVGSEVVDGHAMTYIVQRKGRFYVVEYDGLDPLTGKERWRWHPMGHDRHMGPERFAVPRASVAVEPWFR